MEGSGGGGEYCDLGQKLCTTKLVMHENILTIQFCVPHLHLH